MANRHKQRNPLLAHVTYFTLPAATELLGQNMKKGILIGIAGASGSGKTLVANSIIESFGKDLSYVPYEERVGRNFDHPDAFDHDLLTKHLMQLLNGEIISYPIYDYKLHTRSKETKNVGPGVLMFVA
jgi:uridine kinase